MEKKYDVVIVGAGPAGLLAAKAAGTAGLSVALLEKKQDLTKMERLCGQSIVSMNGYYFDDLPYYNRQGKQIGFSGSGFSLNYDGPARNCYGWQMYSPQGNMIALGNPETERQKGDSGCVGIAYDKEILYRCLLEEVKNAGVEVFSGINVNKVSAHESGVIVSGDDKRFEGSYVIGADGTNSRVARSMGFNSERTFYCYLLCKGFYMENIGMPEKDVFISAMTCTTDAPGIMFIFPRCFEGEHIVTFLTLDPRAKLDDIARYFMKESRFFSPWFSNAKIGKTLAASQYIYSPIREPYRDRVLLAGDSGACQELEAIGAMISGWKAGNAIASAVKEENVGIEQRGINDYLQWWKTVYLEGCPHEAYLGNFILPNVLERDEDMDYLFGLIKETLPPCWDPYAAGKYLGQTIAGLMPTIQQERPDVMMKMMKMQQPVSKILEETTKACMPLADLE